MAGGSGLYDQGFGGRVKVSGREDLTEMPVFNVSQNWVPISRSLWRRKSINSDTVLLWEYITLHHCLYFQKRALKLYQVLVFLLWKYTFSKKGSLHLLRIANGLESLFYRVYFIRKLTVKWRSGENVIELWGHIVECSFNHDWVTCVPCSLPTSQLENKLQARVCFLVPLELF